MSNEEYLEALGQGIQSLDAKVSFLGKALGRTKIRPLPMYLAENPDQLMEELAAQGKFDKPDAGWQDDLRNTFRYFIKTNERGDKFPGLESKYRENAPASLMEMYETVTVANFIWNFTPVGYASAFRGGWNVAVDESRKAVDEKIASIRKASHIDLKSTVDYYDLKSKLDKLVFDEATGTWKYKTPEPNIIAGYGHRLDENGKTVRDNNGNPIIEPKYIIETPAGTALPALPYGCQGSEGFNVSFEGVKVTGITHYDVE
jgi:hypothetical protein